MSRIDRFALLLSVAAVLASAFVSIVIFEGLPHIEDEMAFTWQAKVIARGQLTVPTPEPCPKCFLVPFVVDYHGLRFGKYPLGWPVVLAAGEKLGIRAWINPLLGGFTVWLIYLLVKKVLDERTALLAAFLTSFSPFFLMNSGSLLSHPLSLLLGVAFALAWLDAFTFPNNRLPERWQRSLPTITAGLAMGGLALTRPMTAVAIALPFAFHGVYLLMHGDRAVRLRLIRFGAVAGAIALLHFAWQFAVTGDPLLNPYTLWWPYDKIGFGPGAGLQAGGYQPQNAITNASYSLGVGASDLFGWPWLSWLFMPFGLVAFWQKTRREQDWRPWLLTAVFVSTVLMYGLYWIGSWLFGPRYYYESLFSLVLLTAAGIRWLMGRIPLKQLFRPGFWKQRSLLRPGLVTLFVSGLVVTNLFFFLPARLDDMRGLYGVSRACYQPFLAEEQHMQSQALVIVHVQEKWIDYGCMLDLSSPFLDSQFVLTVSQGSLEEQALAKKFSQRVILHYYPDTGRLSEIPLDFPRQ